MKRKKLLERLLRNPKGVRFAELRGLVEAFGFVLDRTSGSHHVFKHPDVPELLTLQFVQGDVKPYQVRQFLSIVEEYNLKLEEE